MNFTRDNIFFLTFITILLGIAISAEAIAPNPIDKPGWVLDHNDEFNGTSLDTNLWIPYYFESRTNKERAAANYRVEGGNLYLYIAQNHTQYRSGGSMKISSIQTGQRDYLHKDDLDHNIPTIMNYTPQYGYFEIRAKTYPKSGYHCAFWTVGRRDQPWQECEIDIMEQWGADRDNYANIYKWDDPKINSQKFHMTLPFDPGADFHIYAVEWDAASIKYYVDNVLIHKINQSPDYPAVFLLGIYENAGWTGTADTSSGYPKEFVIDYFRAYKKSTGTANTSKISTHTIPSATFRYFRIYATKACTYDSLARVCEFQILK